MKTYVVRRPGHAAWSEHRSREAAERERKIANSTVAWGHEVFEQESAWYAVVTFGSTAREPRVGRRVSRDIRDCIARCEALRGRGTIMNVHVVKCPSREAARRADISESWPVVWHS